MRGDRPVLELGGEQLVAGGARASGGAGRATRGRVAVGDDVDHAVDRLVVEDLVERAQPGRRVVARHDEEAEPVQAWRSSGAALHHGRPDLGHAVGGGTAREPVGELRLADSGHPGHGDRRVAVPQEPADPLGRSGEAGEHGAGDGGTERGVATRAGQDRPDPGGGARQGASSAGDQGAASLRSAPAPRSGLRPGVLAGRGRCGGGRRVPRAPYERAPPRPRSTSRRAR